MKTTALILGLAAWLTPTLALADMMSVSSQTASFRAGPSPKDKVLFSADLYYPVQIVEKKGTWTKVRDFEGETAWVTSQHLVAKPTVVIKADRANIREKANTDADVLFQVERGEVFKVVDRKGNWVSVIDANKDGGWIRADMTWGLDDVKEEVASGGEDDKPKPECTCTKKSNEVAQKAADKADKATEKAERAETKAEKAEAKAEKAEAAAEKAETKADKAETKAEKADKVATEAAADDDDAPAPKKEVAAKPATEKTKADKPEKPTKADKAKPEKAQKSAAEKKKAASDKRDKKK